MASTKPPGAKTGLTTNGCYAAALHDCDGKAASREHYISEGLLKRIPNVLVGGLPWLEKPKRLASGVYASHVLCERHNHALSPVDSAMCQLYDALLDYHDGKSVGWRELDGEDLERWALKTLFGLIASGNITFAEGVENERPTPPIEYLRVLFGDDDVPDGGGLSLIRKPMPDMDQTSEMIIKPLVYPLGDLKAGRVAGVVVYILGVGFYATVNHRFLDDVLLHRPLGIAFGDRGAQGCLALRWNHTAANEVLVVKRTGV